MNTNGLSNKEVLESRKKYGTNEITSKKNKSFFKQFVETLGDPIIKILLIALCIKTVFLFKDFDWFETLGIMIAFFALFIFMGIFNCFNARTHRLNLFSNLIKNKAFIIIILFIVIAQLILIYYGGNLFRSCGLTIKELFITIIIASSVVPIDWIRKLYLKSKGLKTGV